MELLDMIEVLINCVGYSFEQAYTSSIDILGVYAATGDEDRARTENLKALAEVYNQLSSLSYGIIPHWNVSCKQIEECKAMEV